MTSGNHSLGFLSFHSQDFFPSSLAVVLSPSLWGTVGKKAEQHLWPRPVNIFPFSISIWLRRRWYLDTVGQTLICYPVETFTDVLELHPTCSRTLPPPSSDSPVMCYFQCKEREYFVLAGQSWGMFSAKFLSFSQYIPRQFAASDLFTDLPLCFAQTSSGEAMPVEESPVHI